MMPLTSMSMRMVGLALLATAPVGMASAQNLPAGVVMLTMDEIQLQPSPNPPPGSANAELVGSRSKPGFWVERVRFPANFIHQPHSHPDNRTYTVISGTLHVGFGDRVDETKLKKLPPGSFWTEPANVVHFLVTRDEPVTFQITGNGPSGTTFVDPAHDPRKR
jgi:quercetin dioxygenase-like cupin family protein